METKHVQFGEAKQKELDNAVRKLAHAQGPAVAVEAELERRLSYPYEGKVQHSSDVEALYRAHARMA